VPSATSAKAPPDLSVLWECQKILDGIIYRQSEQLVSIFVDICSTYIFPNIDLNEWTDHRGFYFDARPSHGVQMLHFYLKALSRSLLHHLLPHSVQCVVAHTARRCAELLLLRYQDISPSRMRSTHFRLDITYLVAALQTLQSTCGPWYDKLGLESLCGDLLATMTVVVGPIAPLCSFLQQKAVGRLKQKSFHLSQHQRDHSADDVLPNFAAELWRNAEDPLRADVLPLEDSQFLLEKHASLSSYKFNYDGILECFCSDLPHSFLMHLVGHRPELKDNVYPPLSEEEQQLLPILHEFLRPP